MNLSRLEVVIVVAAVIVLCIGFYTWGETKHEPNYCDCTINYGGHNMSVEDAFERAGEGLTVDQADEVQVLIEEYCDNGGE